MSYELILCKNIINEKDLIIKELLETNHKLNLIIEEKDIIIHMKNKIIHNYHVAQKNNMDKMRNVVNTLKTMYEN